MIEYRGATLADSARLSSLGRQSFAETFGHLYDPADLAAFLAIHDEANWSAQLSDAAYSILIVEEQGDPVGYAKLGPPSLPFEPVGSPIELRQFYVLKRWHGAQVAPRMMDWVLSEARRHRADAIYLSVFTDNHRARRFYDRYGFGFVKTYQFLVGNHADEDHILRLDLA